MANEEAFTLDGLALNDGITFAVLNVSWPPPRQRQDWIGAADSEAQLLVRNPLHENRKVTLRVVVLPQSTMDLALAKIAQALDKLQKASRYADGIGLVWTPATSTLSCTFDVLAGEITDLPVDWENGWLAKSPQFTIELTCKPYWRGTETLTSTTSSSTPFVAAEITGVTGDVPALGRLIVTDTATQSRRHVEWGLEGPLTYNASTSLLIDSDDMVTSGFGGTQSTQAGSYDPNAAGNNVITMSAYKTPMAMAGLGNLSHIGTFAVKARMYGVSNELWVRLSWRVGDGPTTTNDWAVAVFGTVFRELDLGTVTIPAVVSGTQRWTGQVEVMVSPTNTSAGEPGTAKIDYLTLVPTADGYGKARATFNPSPGVMVGYDAFVGTTAAAALGVRAAPVGGSWATSGDATDYAFADAPTATEETLSRAAISGTAGRIALLGTSTPTDVQVQSRIYNASVPLTASATLDMAVIARYVDSSNYLYATFRRTTDSSGALSGKTLEIRQVLAGADTQLATSASYTGLTTARWWTVDLTVYATGVALARLLSAAGAETLTTTASSSVLATAGALASGKSGLLDRNTSTTVFTRYYDAFTIFTPAAAPIVLYSGRNLQVRYDDVIRQDSTGTYTGPPASYRGSRFLVPVGTSRVLVKARRNDIESDVDDNVTDATQIQIGWTPRGLAVPR